ncbi:MAG: DUF2851 family protein [Dehalococcoidia bacterium]|nr:MAG: DUF2851 family protein [Dehalococcoidia bacterium]
MLATALAEAPARYQSARGPSAEPPDPADTGTLPGEPLITAAWLLGRVPATLLPWPLLRAGRAGRGPGPDVREAVALLPSGVPAAGDVEVHRTATDFAQHGHAGDPRYASLLLHLVWRDDRGAAERGGPVRLAGGGLAPTIALEPALGSRARLEAAVALGPAGLGEPCAASRLGRAPAETEALLRLEGRRRLGERVWRAQHLAAEVGWEAAWRTLLDRALAASAGRRAESAAARVALADAVGAAFAGDRIDLLRGVTEVVRSAEGSGPAAIIVPLRTAGLGVVRAREVGWNVVLPVAVALAAAYGDLGLAHAAHAAIERWPAPPPYGKTRALAALAEVTPHDALTAQGLLRMQDLWCTRGGCGHCPLSPVDGRAHS